MIDYTYEEKTNLAEALEQLFSIVALLRSPEGCPWDREQDNKHAAVELMDETYEYLDALHDGDAIGQSEEVGDVMLNAMRLLQMHDEHGDFDIVKSINDVSGKLIRRHPHVFSDVTVENSEEVRKLWGAIKRDVEGKRDDEDDFFSRVPKSLPPLEQAGEIQKKLRKVGFDWPDKQGAIDKICEELDEVIEEDTALDRNQDEVELEVGDLLFAVINYARFLHVSPSVALHRSNEKVKARFNAVRSLCAERNIPLDAEHLEAMDALWNEVKQDEKH